MKTPSYITLSSTAPERLGDFYAELGLEMHREAGGALICFSLGALTLAIFPADALARELGVDALPTGLGRTLISLNLESPEAVERLLAKAQAAGATVTRPVQQADWGGVRGYFLDPEGNPWELAFNPNR